MGDHLAANVTLSGFALFIDVSEAVRKGAPAELRRDLPGGVRLFDAGPVDHRLRHPGARRLHDLTLMRSRSPMFVLSQLDDGRLMIDLTQFHGTELD
jgi:hypothetical protein